MADNVQLKKMDMHVHTRFSTEESDLKGVKISVSMASDPVELYKKAKSKGMDFVTFTDHNTIDGCLYLLEKMPCAKDFIISEEITAHDPEYGFVIHINVYDITKAQHKRILKLKGDFYKLTRYLKKRGVLYCYNHPYWQCQHDYLAATEKPQQRVYEIAKHFPLIEGINSFRLKQQNQMARKMAKDLGVTSIAGSDSHGGGIGRAYTMAKANNVKDFLKEIKEGRVQVRGWNYSFKGLYEECMNIVLANVDKVKEEYPSKKLKVMMNLFANPLAKFFVRRHIKKNVRIQKKAIKPYK